ncbi:MAG: hypothetical protein WCE92_04930 [Nitrososphaeraceae archaeon]
MSTEFPSLLSNISIYILDASVLITFFINNSDGSSLTSLAPKQY